MSNYSEFITKTQTDILNAVKQAQETNVKALTSFGDAIADYASKTKSIAGDAKAPSATEVIESAFGFTTQLVELQKSYYLKLAETFANAQKKATDGVSTAPAKK